MYLHLKIEFTHSDFLRPPIGRSAKHAQKQKRIGYIHFSGIAYRHNILILASGEGYYPHIILG